MTATTFHGGGIFSRLVNGRETFYCKVWVPSERRTRVWKAGYTLLQGERKRKEVGRDPDAAAAKRQEVRAAAREKRAQLTVEGLFKLFAPSYVSKRGGTKAHRALLKAPVAFLGGIPAASLSIADVDRYLAARRALKRDTDGGRRAGETTLGKEVIMLRVMMRWAKKRGHIPVNVLAEVEVPAAEVREQPRAITRDEEAKLLALLPPLERDIAEWSIYCGMRISETLSLEWPRIDRTAGLVHVVKTKTGKSRVFPLSLSSRLAAILDRHPRRTTTSLLFHDHAGARLNLDKLNNVLEGAWKAAGIPKVRGVLWNAFRKTCSSRLYASGKVLPQDEAAWLGHAPAVAWAHYVEYSHDSNARAAGALDVVGNGMGNSPADGRIGTPTDSSQHAAS